MDYEVHKCDACANLKPESFTTATVTIVADKQACTLTLDTGIENKQHAAITAAIGIRVFFCDPYSSWQKGSVEHANKLLRRYVPKGCNLGSFTQAQVDDFVAILHNISATKVRYSWRKRKALSETE